VYPVIPDAADEQSNAVLAQGPTARPRGAVTDTADEPEASATCPRCHLVDATLTNRSVAAGGYWRCARCGSNWDQGRLATVAGDAAWDSARQPVQQG
jgi:hypothetical protein